MPKRKEQGINSAALAELVDAADSKSAVSRRPGSNPGGGTEIGILRGCQCE